MSRWICIDDIYIPSDENDWEELVAFADAIAEQEPIDICFCRECKYWHEGKCWNIKGLNKTDGVVKADDFCSYGDLKEELNGSKGSLNSSEKPNKSTTEDCSDVGKEKK